VASNVDYPYLLYRIAAGLPVETPEVNYAARTEAPVVGLLATLDEIAHDEKLWRRFEKLREECSGRGDRDPADGRLAGFFRALREAGNPSDLKAYLRGMFEKHGGAINDVLQSDDPRPVLGALFPVALALRSGKLSMGVLTGEKELDAQRPRRRLRDLLRQPTWTTVWLTALLYALCVFAVHADLTRNNLGWVLGFPMRLAEQAFGTVAEINQAAPLGALKYTLYHMLNLAWLYLIAALALWQRRKP
jgi:hypothetical protein